MHVTMKRLINIAVMLPTCLRIQIKRGTSPPEVRYVLREDLDSNRLKDKHVWNCNLDSSSTCQSNDQSVRKTVVE